MFNSRFTFHELLVGLYAQFKATQKSEEPPEKPEEEAAEGAPEFRVHWIDWRERKKTKSRGKAKGSRPWSKITGMTLHQTAVNITDPENCLNIPVHGVVMAGGPNGEDATIILLHDPTDYMYHGNGFNRRDIGIEVCCRAAGVEDDPNTAKNESILTTWLPKSVKERIAAGKTTHAEQISEATDAELEACRRLMRYYCEQAEKNGGAIEFIHAHRQATKNRVSDPGSRIWGACGEWGRDALGLNAGPPDFKISDGMAIPDAWTGRAHGIRYNWRVDGRIEKTR